MNVSEHFYSIQGEGPYVGTPTTFLRLSGCNLNCEWCDSKYHKYGERKGIDEVVNIIKEYGCKDVTVTGGEPTLQEVEMSRVMEILKPEGYVFNLETNGLIYSVLDYDHIVVSPKKQKVNLETLSSYIFDSDKGRDVNFKFVYDDKNNLWWEEVLNNLESKTFDLTNFKKNHVYIMPEGYTRESQIDRMSEVFEYCMDKNFKFSGRIHVLTYDTKRGV